MLNINPLFNIQTLNLKLIDIEQKLKTENFNFHPKKMISDLQGINTELLSLRQIVKSTKDEELSTKTLAIWKRCYQICQGKRIEKMHRKADKTQTLSILTSIKSKLRLLNMDVSLNQTQKDGVLNLLQSVEKTLSQIETLRQGCVLLLSSLETDSLERIKEVFFSLNAAIQRVIFEKLSDLSNNNSVFNRQKASYLFDRFNLQAIKTAVRALLEKQENCVASDDLQKIDDYEIEDPIVSGVRWDNLSYEVITPIFKGLDSFKDFSSLFVVNKHYYCLNNDKQFWQQILKEKFSISRKISEENPKKSAIKSIQITNEIIKKLFFPETKIEHDIFAAFFAFKKQTENKLNEIRQLTDKNVRINRHLLLIDSYSKNLEDAMLKNDIDTVFYLLFDSPLNLNLSVGFLSRKNICTKVTKEVLQLFMNRYHKKMEQEYQKNLETVQTLENSSKLHPPGPQEMLLSIARGNISSYERLQEKTFFLKLEYNQLF